MSSFAFFKKSSAEYIETINTMYQQYIDDSSYVFKSCNRGKHIVILKKPPNHVNNESRSSVVNHKFAKHRGTDLYVEIIFDKFEPSRTFNNTIFYFCGIETLYTVGKTVSPDSYTADNSDDADGLYYFKSIDGAFYCDLFLINYFGEYNDFHYNGLIKEHGNMYNGTKNGVWKEYYDNGQLMTIEHYVFGKLNGEYFEYYSNGNISERGVYSNDEPSNFHISWHENGAKASEGYYDESGRKNGVWLSWYDDGCRDEFTTYNHGTLNGLYYKWKKDKLDELVKHGMYVDGKYTEKLFY